MSLFSIFAFFSQFGQVSLRAFVGSHSLARFRYPALALVGPCLPVRFALASRWLRVRPLSFSMLAFSANPL